MLSIYNILSFLFNCGILAAGLMAISKIPFFSTKMNPKKEKGKTFLKNGLILKFGSAAVSGLFVIFLNNFGFYFGPINLVFSATSLVGWVGIALIVIGAVYLYQGAQTQSAEDQPAEEEKKEEVKKPLFKPNEEISQRAQFPYAKFRKEYEEGVNVLDEEAEAKLFAKAVELQLLKTPASAVFCDMEEMSVLPVGEGAYSVSGYVDSQNSYGAMLRSQFTLLVLKDENGTWKNADRFVSTAQSVNNSIISSTIIWWILGIIGTIITLAVSYAFTSMMF